MKLNESLLRIQESAKSKEIDFKTNDLKKLIVMFGDLIFTELTDIFNIIFSSGNPGFEKFTVLFVENNFTIPMIKMIIKNVVEMNELESMLPFSMGSFREMFWEEVTKELSKQKERKGLKNPGKN